MKLLATICFLLVFFASTFSQNKNEDYKNPKIAVEKRVKDLLSRMTLEEKIAQLSMKSLGKLKMDKDGNVTDSSLVVVFGGLSTGCIESPLYYITCEKIAKFAETADNYLRTKTRLGIPAIQIAECIHGQLAIGTTKFPQDIGLGSTWTPSLIKDMASVIASEATQSGVKQALSPVFDLARDPRYGRVEECYGEDPYLVKEMDVAFVKGIQGDPETTRLNLASNKMICTAKHFMAYSIPQAGINLGPASVGERELRTLHMYPFEAAVKEANIYSIMPCYNEVDGIPLHANRLLLKDNLRKELGFNGYIFSDYGGVSMLRDFQKVAVDCKDAALQAINAGIDLESLSNETYSELISLVKEGKLKTSVIDEAVVNVHRIKFKSGLFDNPFKVSEKISSKVHTPENIALAQKIAEESIVLLKSGKNILPLNKNLIKSIAVIGPNADRVLFGDYSMTKSKDYGTTTLEGLKKYLGNDIAINYTIGCDIADLSKVGFEEVVSAARKSDIVVMVMGGTSATLSGVGWGIDNAKEVNTCGEGYDRTELDFPGVQPELIAEIAKTGKSIILIMLHGRPYTIGKELNLVDAVLEAWYPEEKGGVAIARILFGEVNPSGRLPITFSQTVGHIPVFSNYKPSAKGYYKIPGTFENPGRDYVFSSPDPLFCFGYGLSYTTFEYSNIQG
jgi:beta-glucosidase